MTKLTFQGLQGGMIQCFDEDGDIVATLLPPSEALFKATWQYRREIFPNMKEMFDTTSYDKTGACIYAYAFEDGVRAQTDT